MHSVAPKCAWIARALAILLGAAILAACNETAADVALPPQQLFGATSLTAAERKEQIRSLTERLSALWRAEAKNQKEMPTATQFEAMCTCIVDNLQDRTTRLQFIMAIELRSTATSTLIKKTQRSVRWHLPKG